MGEMILKVDTTKEKVEKYLKLFLKAAIPVVLLWVSIWYFAGVNASNHALNHANLNRNDVSFVRFELDIDDFIPKYEVSWYQGNREVEYTVHAISGFLFEIDS